MSTADIVDGRLRLEEGRTRHLTYRVTRKGGRGLFVKHAQDAGAAATLENEAAIYQLLSRGECVRLRLLLPKFVFFDRTASRLVLESVADSRDTDEASLRPGAGTEDIAAWLGEALAVCHSSFRSPAALMPLPGISEPPWPLSIGNPPIEWLAELSPAQAELIRLVQNSAPLMNALGEAYESWNPSALTHGDIRPANIIAVSLRDGAIGLRLIDWELAGWGDPMWDVASAFQGYLLECFTADSWSDLESPEAAARLFGAHLPEAQRQIAALWSAYHKHLRGRLTKAGRGRVTIYAAARLIQSAYEASSGAGRLGREVSGMLQLGVNIAAQPKRALTDLFGLASE